MGRGVDIVSACPGRLLDHIQRGTINLSHIEVLVLDEADRMFDMGFLPDIRKIVRHLPAVRQTLLFSATMPDDVRGLTREIQKDPVRVQISPSVPADTVTHTFYPVEPHSKNELLKSILDRITAGPVLVFTRTKHRSKSLARRLEKSGYDAAALHGNLSQNRRQMALEGFRNGRYKILVATDVAARGIDVRGISHVINFDVPDTADAYTHRTGRTGRAHETGDAFTFVSKQDKLPMRLISKVLGSKVTYAAADGLTGGKTALQKKPFRSRTGRAGARKSTNPAVGNGTRSVPNKHRVPNKTAGRKKRRSSKGNGALGTDLIMSLAGHPNPAA
jgi:ATP-dependent RNA helicase RhlE